MLVSQAANLQPQHVPVFIYLYSTSCMPPCFGHKVVKLVPKGPQAELYSLLLFGPWMLRQKPTRQTTSLACRSGVDASCCICTECSRLQTKAFAIRSSAVLESKAQPTLTTLPRLPRANAPGDEVKLKDSTERVVERVVRVCQPQDPAKHVRRGLQWHA